MKKSRINWYFMHPTTILTRLATMYPKVIKSDKLFVNLLYYTAFSKFPDLENPKTYNEKLQWLKLYNRNPEYINMVDKCEAKNYVSSIIGEKYIIPTLGVYNNFDEIDFDSLPNQFVLKCTHDSGGIVICKDKSKVDREKAKEKLQKNMAENIFWRTREWPYKKIEPRIISEKYMSDESGELRDYKFFCFNGEVKAMFIATERFAKEETKFDFYDVDFNHLPFVNGHSNSDKEIKKPKNFELMKELACRLSKGIPHVRVDFYEVEGEVYFGELTFFHYSGIVPFEPAEWDEKFGSYIDLPEKKIIAE